MIVTVETLKSILGIEWSSEDTLLQTILTNAQWLAEVTIGRPIEQATYSGIEMDWHGERIFFLKHYPIITFTSIEYRDWVTWSAVTDEYSVKKETGQVRFPYSIVPRGFDNVRVSYVAGWTSETVPADLKQAIIDIASTVYNTRNSAWIKREKVDGSEIEFTQAESLSPSAEKVLSSYRPYNV